MINPILTFISSDNKKTANKAVSGPSLEKDQILKTSHTAEQKPTTETKKNTTFEMTFNNISVLSTDTLTNNKLTKLGNKTPIKGQILLSNQEYKGFTDSLVFVPSRIMESVGVRYNDVQNKKEDYYLGKYIGDVTINIEGFKITTISKEVMFGKELPKEIKFTTTQKTNPNTLNSEEQDQLTVFPRTFLVDYCEIEYCSSEYTTLCFTMFIDGISYCIPFAHLSYLFDLLIKLLKNNTISHFSGVKWNSEYYSSDISFVYTFLSCFGIILMLNEEMIKCSEKNKKSPKMAEFYRKLLLNCIKSLFNNLNIVIEKTEQSAILEGVLLEKFMRFIGLLYDFILNQLINTKTNQLKSQKESSLTLKLKKISDIQTTNDKLTLTDFIEGITDKSDIAYKLSSLFNVSEDELSKFGISLKDKKPEERTIASLVSILPVVGVLAGVGYKMYPTSDEKKSSEKFPEGPKLDLPKINSNTHSNPLIPNQSSLTTDINPLIPNQSSPTTNSNLNFSNQKSEDRSSNPLIDSVAPPASETKA